MFKNKKIIYFLLPATLLIWGGIILKILNATDNKISVIAIESNSSKTQANIPEASAYKIEANYRDPFFPPKNNRKTGSSSDKQINQNKIISDKLKTDSLRANIVYKGMISSSSKKGPTAILQINNNEYSRRQNDTIGSYTIAKILRDSVKLQCKGREYYLIRSSQ